MIKKQNRILKQMRQMLRTRIDSSHAVRIMCAHNNRIYATTGFTLVELDTGWDLEYEGPIFGRDIKPDTLKSLLSCKYQDSKDEAAMVSPALLESVLKVFRAARENPRIHVTSSQIYLYSEHIRAVVMPMRY